MWGPELNTEFQMGFFQSSLKWDQYFVYTELLGEDSCVHTTYNRACMAAHKNCTSSVHMALTLICDILTPMIYSKLFLTSYMYALIVKLCIIVNTKTETLHYILDFVLF